MKKMVYCAVFGDYDKVYPPVFIENDLDYYIFTDDNRLRVRGWKTIHVMNTFSSPKAANVYYRALGHLHIHGYDASLYVDGSIRLIGKTTELFEKIIKKEVGVFLYNHPVRNTVKDELLECIKQNKITNKNIAKCEYNYYKEKGFLDNVGLFSTGVLLKNHNNLQLDQTMKLWNEMYQKYCTRDQLSFPFSVWKTNISVEHINGKLRSNNPYFVLGEHKLRNITIRSFFINIRNYIIARSHDSKIYLLLINTWKLKRRIMQNMLGKR